MTRYRPESIEDVGLEKFLDDRRSVHDGLGYKEFVAMLNKGINKSNLGRIFKVDRRTVEYWAIVYEAALEK